MTDIPTNTNFVYSRRNPPLFFAEPNPSEVQYWNNSMSNVTREYFKKSRKHKMTSRTPLSNGMTAGEYAMWLLLTNHEKRTTNSY
jgi:hypothetical protein